MATVKARLETATARRERAREVMCEANSVATAAAEKVRALERDARGSDAIARLKAEGALQAARLDAAHAEARALEAREAFAALEPAWRREAYDAGRPRISADAQEVFDAAVVLEKKIAKLQRTIEDVIATGVPASSLPLNELTLALAFGKTAGESYFAKCCTYLKRHSWIEVKG